MSTLRFVILLFGAIAIFTGQSYGQGCSDAGFCTISNFQPHGNDSVKVVNNQIKIGAYYGNADRSIAVIGSYVEYNRQFNEKLGVDIRLTSLAQTGNGIAVFGLSDIYVTANYAATEKLSFTLGTKIPLSNADKSLNNLPLPMDYQASLGTLDLIFGIGYEIKKLQLVAAIQQPLTQNGNEFFNTLYPEESELRAFQSTNEFKRSGDILLRVSYPITLGKKFTLTPSLLPIYHLANDKFTDETNVQQEIIGSQGLTLNGNLYMDYQINRKNIIQINMGVPFVVRDARPDGLTRSFIVNLEYKINF